MKLQLALDFSDGKKALKLTKKVYKYVDIIEIGTPLVKSEGLKIIKKFKRFRKPILADLKTMDTGFFEAELAFKAGASYTTVCGCADNETIKGAIKAARKYKKKVIVDLISTKDAKKRAREISKFKPDYINIHTGIDEQNKGQTPLSNLIEISKIMKTSKITVAGGINLKTIDIIKKYRPAIIVVGGAITKANNPKQVAMELSKKIK